MNAPACDTCGKPCERAPGMPRKHSNFVAIDWLCWTCGKGSEVRQVVPLDTVCPCETDVGEPGPHISSCRYSDPSYGGETPW